MLSNHLPTKYQEFIHLSRYSRWLPDKGRRESWTETIARYFDFFKDHLKDTVNYDLPEEGTDVILNIGNSSTNVVVWGKNCPFFSRNIEVYFLNHQK